MNINLHIFETNIEIWETLKSEKIAVIKINDDMKNGPKWTGTESMLKSSSL